MKATFRKHPKSYAELSESLAVALMHGNFSLAERAACRLADTSNEGSSAVTDKAWELWREIETMTPTEKRLIASLGFWRAMCSYVHDWFVDADLGDSTAAYRFAEFCFDHLEGSSHQW